MSIQDNITKNLFMSIQDNITKNLLEYSVLTTLMGLIIMIGITMPSEGKSFDRNKGSFYSASIIFFILANVYIYKFVSKSIRIPFYKISSVIISIGALTWFIFKAGLFHTAYSGTIAKLLLVSIFLFGLTIFLKSFRRHIQNMDGLSGFIINFILYIPCLLEEFIEYIKYQLGLTPSVTYILLGIELLLITSYIMLPSLMSKAIKSDSYAITNEAHFLNQPGGHQLATIKEIYEKDDAARSLTEKPYQTPRRTFSLSCWIYLNQQKPNVTHKTIFKYGNPPSNSHCHPEIKYTGERAGKNMVDIIFSRKTSSHFSILLDGQQWHNIVFNYSGNQVDLFINGDLVKTNVFDKTAESNVDSEMFDDKNTFSIGDDDLDGAICNIKYYKKPLTRFQITNIYNLLNGQNPPINNVM